MNVYADALFHTPDPLLRCLHEALAHTAKFQRLREEVADELWRRDELRALAEWVRQNFPAA